MSSLVPLATFTVTTTDWEWLDALREGPVTVAMGVVTVFNSNTANLEQLRALGGRVVGSVTEVKDAQIGRKVYCVVGTVPAANYIEISALPGGGKKLSSAPFLYFELKALEGVFTFHLDVVTKDDRHVHVSFSNIFSEICSTELMLRIPTELSVDHWTVFAFDMNDLLTEHINRGYKALRSVKLCSNMLVRGAYTSQSPLHNLPPGMSLPGAELVWMPHPPRRKSPVRPRIKGTKRLSRTKVVRPRQKSPREAWTLAEAGSSSDMPSRCLRLERVVHYSCGRQSVAWLDKDKIAFASHSTVIAMQVPVTGGEDVPDSACAVVQASPPAAHLRTMPQVREAAEGGTCGGENGDARDREGWEAGRTGIHEGWGKQSFLFGHTDAVTVLEASHDKALLATAQGPDAIVRLWDHTCGRCLAVIKAHDSDLITLAFAPDAALLCTVGHDHRHRVQVKVWDVGLCLSTQQACVSDADGDALVARQLSDFSINTIKWSPFESGRLLSCGDCSVRFWRISHRHLPASSASLGCFAREHFTDLCFESLGAKAADEDSKVVFVATSQGLLLELDSHTRSVLCALRLQNKTIRAVVANEAFVVTGSEDCVVRVWPLDFGDYVLESRNEATISTLALSEEGLRLVVGNTSGCMGLLDLTTSTHRNLMRSHQARVTALSACSQRQVVASADAGGVIRVWSLQDASLCCEFLAPTADQPTCLDFSPRTSQHVLVCGFSSGCVRIMDVAAVKTCHEFQQHHGSVLQLRHDSSGQRLYSAASCGTICVYDAHCDYQPVHMVSLDSRQDAVALALSPDSTLLAVTRTAAACSIVLFDTDSMQVRCQLHEPRPLDHFGDIFFLDDHSLVATTAEHILRFDVARLHAGDASPSCEVFASKLSCGSFKRVVPSAGARYLFAVGSPPTAAAEAGHCANAVLHVLARRAGDESPEIKTVSFTTLESVKMQGDIQALVTSGSHVITGDAVGSVQVWLLCPSAPTVDVMVARGYGVEPEMRVGAAEDVEGARLMGEYSHNPQNALVTTVARPGQGQEAQRGVEGAMSGLVGHATNRHAVRRGSCNGLELHSPVAVWGFDGLARNNLLWLESRGVMVYTVDIFIVVEDLEMRATRAALPAHSAPISCLAADSDEGLIASGCDVDASGSGDLEVKLWRLDSVNQISEDSASFTGCGGRALAFSPPGRYLAALALDGALTVINVKALCVVARVMTAPPGLIVTWAAEATLVSLSPYGMDVWCMAAESENSLERMHMESWPAEDVPMTAAAGMPCPRNSFVVGDGRGMLWWYQTVQSGLKLVHHWCVERHQKEAEDVTCLLSTGTRLVVGHRRTVSIWECRAASDRCISELLITLTLSTGSAQSLQFDQLALRGVIGTSAGDAWFVELEPVSKSALRVKAQTMIMRSPNAASLRLAAAVDSLGAIVATSSLDLWRVSALAPLFQRAPHPGKGATCLTFLRPRENTGLLLAWASEAGIVIVVDLDHGEAAEHALHHGATVSDLQAVDAAGEPGLLSLADGEVLLHVLTSPRSVSKRCFVGTCAAASSLTVSTVDPSLFAFISIMNPEAPEVLVFQALQHAPQRVGRYALAQLQRSRAPGMHDEACLVALSAAEKEDLIIVYHAAGGSASVHKRFWQQHGGRAQIMASALVLAERVTVLKTGGNGLVVLGARSGRVIVIDETRWCTMASCHYHSDPVSDIAILKQEDEAADTCSVAVTSVSVGHMCMYTVRQPERHTLALNASTWE